jgi:hypothetical protein
MTVQTHIDLNEKIATYEETRANGARFLLANIGRDGEVADSQRPRVSYYRLPWALQLCGETATAFRVLDWIERNRIGDDGRCAPGVPWDAAANRTVNTYAETCLAYGATLLRRFDLARRLMDYAGRWQDPETGGVFMNRDETGADGRQLVFLTAQFGMSAVITGRMAEAINVGEWFARLWQAQPALDDRLYTIWTRAGGLATEAPPGENARHYVNEKHEIRQYHYNGGIAAAFLAHLFMATGEWRWLDLARGYQRFSMESTPAQFEVKQICKSAWGAGLIALASGDASYGPWLVKMGDWFTAGQEEDGRWRNSVYLDPTPPLAHMIEATAEFVVHVDTVIAALATLGAKD